VPVTSIADLTLHLPRKLWSSVLKRSRRLAKVRSGIEKVAEGTSRVFGCGGLGLALGHGVASRHPVDRHHRPWTFAVLAAQLDKQTGPVVLDAQTVRGVPVLMQDPPSVGVGDE
jgi:hypothetical protein